MAESTFSNSSLECSEGPFIFMAGEHSGGFWRSYGMRVLINRPSAILNLTKTLLATLMDVCIMSCRKPVGAFLRAYGGYRDSLYYEPPKAHSISLSGLSWLRRHGAPLRVGLGVGGPERDNQSSRMAESTFSKYSSECFEDFGGLE